MTKIRVLLADDHSVVREGLKALVNGQPDMEVVGDAADGQAACEQAALTRPDVVVMDVSMPRLTGSQAAARLRRECPSARVLALTVHESTGYIRQLLAAGAVGYVLKRAAADELIQAIRTVAAGGVYLDPSMAGKVVGGFVRSPPPGAPTPTGGALSDREEDVARQTAAGHSNK
jgi:DNA-binding NarL/FixJ family response regulator